MQEDFCCVDARQVTDPTQGPGGVRHVEVERISSKGLIYYVLCTQFLIPT